MIYGVSADFIRRRKEDGKSWHCPQGHSIVFTESDKDRLEKKLAEAARTNTVLAAQVASAQAQRDRERKRAVRLEKRAKGGACPCCNRTFIKLSRHMATKHPDFAKP